MEKFMPGVPNTMRGGYLCLRADYKMANTYKKDSLANFFKLMFRDRGFNYVVWLRLCLLKPRFFRMVAKCVHRMLSTCYGIQIPVSTKIGVGFRINHGVGIIFNETTQIGEGCCFHQFTTIGTWDGKAAIIGNNVLVGPGVNIVENVNIGNNVIIGAGAVVVKDAPQGCTIAGNPARILKR